MQRAGCPKILSLVISSRRVTWAPKLLSLCYLALELFLWRAVERIGSFGPPSWKNAKWKMVSWNSLVNKLYHQPNFYFTEAKFNILKSRLYLSVVGSMYHRTLARMSQTRTAEQHRPLFRGVSAIEVNELLSDPSTHSHRQLSQETITISQTILTTFRHNSS